MAIFRSILIADDEPAIRHVLTVVLTERGYQVQAVADGEEALRALGVAHFDAVISDVRMPKLDGMALLQRALAQQPDLTFLVMSAHGSEELALAAVGAGAYDYVQKPFRPEEMVLAIKKAEERIRLVRENRRLRNPRGLEPLARILGESAAIKELRRQIQKLAGAPSTVLITGESGTGKELVARALHELSPRSGMPFVTVNCGAIPAGLIESELFGHAKGAFTDARTAKEGLFSEADGGSLFLDEIGELPPEAQVKLLRVLQEGEFRPVGETRVERVDVRVIAATLRDLGKLAEHGQFREDLFYRLNVVSVHVPPLRERRDDIVLLANAFLQRFNRELNRAEPVQGFSEAATSLLTEYAWPGNVRELENAVERAVLLCEGSVIEPDGLPERIWTSRSRGSRIDPLGVPLAIEDLSLKQATRELEERFIRAALRRTKGNRTRAAELLGISHRGLLYKVKEYAIDPDAEGERG
jgi:two-component system, NtrC family, response regulator AtoC